MLVTRRSLVTVGRGPAPTLGPARAFDGLLLVGHGSQCRVSETEMRALAALVSDALPEVAVEVGFLEMTDPPAVTVTDRLVARGVGRVAVLPLMLFAAGHAKSDAPAIAIDARDRFPDIEVHYGRPLGREAALTAIAAANVGDAGGTGLPLVVNARGTSDPDANADACAATRMLAEAGGHPFSWTGFSGVTSPSVPEALRTCARLGAERIAAFAWFLCDGKLVERMRDDYAAFTAETGVEVVDAGYFGPDPRLVPVIVDRYRETIAGEVRMACDRCCYRIPFPGREDRLGQAIGVGHSHLAADHRHHH